jgi:hypothetical protein
MKRRSGTKPKRRAPKKAAASRTLSIVGTPTAAPVEMPADDVTYVAKLAAGIGLVMEAQERLVHEVDTVSRMPQALRDPEWQVRSETAAHAVVQAGALLRIEPVPESMVAVDGILGEAQRQGQLASQAQISGMAEGNAQKMVETLQHLDRMAQLIQQAYAVIKR